MSYLKNEALTIGLRFLFIVKRLLSLFPQQVCSNFLTQVLKSCDAILVHDFRETINDFRAGVGTYEKFAVPTPMAEAPAMNISIAASALSTPPIPMIGRSDARATWRMSLRATGKTAGPDIPP